ncbi:glutathione reductase [Lactococcus termiticola]|uniref:Glutathione reductase n=1 Tax=Lactococcus termiticola TaxID=2169526 RepID=A0A2R5HHJ0_9LACT|nr:glutathione reductase [Lactococcus termiticola]
MSAVETKQKAVHMQEAGIQGELSIDWKQLMARKNAFTEPFPAMMEGSLKSSGLVTLHGEASFQEDESLKVGDELYTADNYLIATGQKPLIPQIPGKEYFKTSNDFLALEEMPASMVFLGTGFVALELAQIAAAAGSQVTVIARHQLKVNGFDQELALDFIDQIAKMA